MFATITLRGQDVQVDGGFLYLTIQKTKNGMFSISDKLREKVCKHKMKLFVTINGRQQEITDKTPHIFIEKVPSKFEGMADWSRYWYKVQGDFDAYCELASGNTQEQEEKVKKPRKEDSKETQQKWF